MAGKANQAIAHEEFEPFCKWQRNNDLDVLEIHLQEFKREHLQVQISSHGILKISGERPLDASRKSKFYKEITISSSYEASAIHAKFVNNWLSITIPKRKTLLVPENDGKKSPESSKIDRTSKPEPAKDQSIASPSSVGAKEHIQSSGGKSLAPCELRLGRVAVTAAATSAALAVLIALVVYVYKLKIDYGRCVSW